MNKVSRILNGEKSFAGKMLGVIPLIDEYFKSFDGERAAVKSGRSAKFQKVTDAFGEKVNELMNDNAFRCYVGESVYFVYIKADVRVSNNSGSCSYFGNNVYIGELDRDSGVFKYTFDEEHYFDAYTKVLSITEESLEAKKAKIAELKKEIDGIESSIPYSIKEALK